MSEFYPLGMSCDQCGKPLEAREIPSTASFTLKGLRSLEYRHTDGTKTCVIIREPRPYDGWQASAAFEAAQREAWDAEDAAACEH